ncbi:unnamed protein product [Rotaria sordida]|uniref:Nuclear receptor domain-containing protein n=1 Tax=Rotaria sordida TaxID=392033 RepID=A0A814IIH5_9BILA|nr:unnamed protein product [Rotaria sordida]
MEETVRIITDANAPSTTVTEKTKAIQSECKICGVTALHKYLGIVACSPCKMFFKRNAKNKLVRLKCDFDGHCEINIHNRHICSFCRLKKCFASGMRIELLRSSLSNKIKTNRKKKEIVESVVTASSALVKVAARNEVQQLSTLNLLQSDQSTLSTDQWNLLSNLVHCYDEHSGYSMAVCYTREQNALPSKARHKVTSVIISFLTTELHTLLDEGRFVKLNLPGLRARAQPSP